MEDLQDTSFPIDHSLSPLTYGSSILLSLSEDPHKVLFATGFIQPSLTIQHLEDASPLNSNEKFPEFSFSLFRILPFMSSENFKWQNKVLGEIQGERKNIKPFENDTNSKERKKDFEELLQSFDLEFNSNLNLYEKMKGCPLLFESSIFQLMHVETLKFLSLNNDNPNDLKFELADFPNEKSFFKFLPCLWIQKNRNNMVYERDYVFISSTFQVCLRNPFLNATQTEKSIEVLLHQKSDNYKINGSIDRSQQWKIFLYNSNLHSGNDVITKSKIGDIVWLCLSEQQVCLSAILKEDPFQCFRDLVNKKLNEKKDKANKLPPLNLTKDLSQVQTNRSIQGFSEEDFNNVELQFIRLNLLEKMGSYQKYAVHSLWKIESQHNLNSDFIKWNTPYRFRHFITGKYLRLPDKESDKSPQNPLELSWKVDEKCYFYFSPVESIFKEEENEKSMYVLKDSYFKLKHCKTNHWLGIEKNEQEPSILKSDVILSPLIKDISILKMRVVEPDVLWENNFILSSISVFLSLLSALRNYHENDNKSFSALRNSLRSAMHTIQSLNDFVMNRLPVNISPKQDFNLPSFHRQKLFVEQHILGFLCWTLDQIFPLSLEPSLKPMKSIGGELGLKSSTKKSMQVDKILKKKGLLLGQEKAELSNMLYKLLQNISRANPLASDYLAKYLPLFTKHIGYGDFVCKTVEEIILSSESILEKISNLQVLNAQSMFSAGKLTKRTFIDEVFSKLRSFQSFEKVELIEFLAQLCHFRGHAIYNNQEKIFKNLFFSGVVNNDKDYMFSFSCNEKDGILFAQYRVKDKKVLFSLNDLSNPQHLLTEPMIMYIKSQMRLYAKLAMGRNNNSFKYLKRFFPYEILIKQIFDDKVERELRAIFCQLAMTLYIDSHPRNLLVKPNFIRIVKRNASEARRDTSLGAKGRYYMDLELDDPRKKRRAASSMTKESLNFSEKKNDKDQKFESLTKILKENILQYFSQFPDPQDPNLDLSKLTLSFNELTLELLRIFFMLLQFGFFKIETHDYSSNAYYNDKSHTQSNANEAVSVDLLYKIFRILAFLLEFDHEYFADLFNNKIIRDSQHNIKFQSSAKKRTIFHKIGGQLEQLGKLNINILNQAPEEEPADNQDNDDQKKDSHINILEAMKYSNVEDFLKRIISYKKFFTQFSAKTFTLKASPHTSFEIQIKSLICDIFDYILSMRDDFLLDNFFRFFTKAYTRRSNLGNIKDFKDVFPEPVLKISIDYKEELKKKTKFIEPDLYNLDHILERPFLETLLLSFYLSHDAEVQEKIMGLIEKTTTISQRFYGNVQKLELLMTFEEKRMYIKINRYIDRLKISNFTTQVWNEVFEQETSEEVDDILVNTYKTLKRILDLLDSDDSLVREIMKTKQEVCVNVRVPEELFKVIQQGLSFCKDFEEIFGNKNTETDEEKRRFLHRKHDENLFKLDLIVEIAKASNGVLECLCKNNPNFQRKLFSLINRLFTSQSKYNIGQVGILCEVFRDNKEVTAIVSDETLEYFTTLIVKHGHFEDFLKFFEVLLNCSNKHNDTEIYKKIVRCLMSPTKFENINPFAPGDRHERAIKPKRAFFKSPSPFSGKLYQNLFIRILETCVSAEIPIDELNKIFTNIKIRQFLLFLQEKCEEFKTIDSEEVQKEYELLQTRKSIVNILIVLLNKLDKGALKELEAAKDVFGSVIEIETSFIETINSLDAIYLLDQLLVLMNIYIENFLKDAWFSNAAEEAGSIKVVILKFAHAAFKNIDKFIKLFENPSNMEKNNDRLKVITVFANYLRLNLQEIHPYFRENKKFQSNFNFSFSKQKTLLEFFCDEPASNEPSEQNLTYQAESPIGHAYGSKRTMDEDQILESGEIEFEKSATSVSQAKDRFLKAKTKIQVNKMKNRIEHKESEKGKNSSVSEGITKSVSSGEKMMDGQNKKKNERNVKDFWKGFRQAFFHSEDIKKFQKKLARKELEVLSKSLINVHEMFNLGQCDDDGKYLVIEFNDILVKCLQFLHFWKERKADKKNVVHLLKLITQTIHQTEDGIKKKNLQNLIERLQGLKILLMLFWEEDEGDYAYLANIVKTLNSLFEGEPQNTYIQKATFEFFMSNPSSEIFFSKLNEIFKQAINLNRTNRPIPVKLAKLLFQIMRMLQLFCEGHNAQLQKYLSDQVNSKNSFDMVGLMANLATSFKISEENYDIIDQCFDTLSEFIQGPCKSNQYVLINSQFLDYIALLLKEHPSIFLEIKDPKKGLGFEVVVQQSMSKSKEKSSKSFNMSGLSLDNEKPSFTFHKGKLARLKYKGIVTISSLLECNDPTDSIATKIKRAIPLSLLIKVLTEVYDLHQQIHQEAYQKAFFLNYQNPPSMDPLDLESAYIIEMGFVLFFIISILSSKKTTISSKDDEEDLENLEGLKQDESQKGVVGNLISNITILNQGLSFGKSFLGAGFDYMKKLKKNIVGIAKDTLTNREKNQLEELQKLKKSMEFKQLKTKALSFFKRHSAHIEIQRDGKFYKVFFPLLPECSNLPKTIKREFHEKVNRTSVKSKVSGLMDESSYFINVIIHEQTLKNIWNQNKILGMIATYEKLWENLSFYINLTLNFIIIASYSEWEITPDTPIEDWDYHRLYRPKLFDLTVQQTLVLFKILGILNLVFSGLAVLLFFMKRGPLLAGGIWRSLATRFKTREYGCFKKGVLYCQAVMRSFVACLSDFTLLFYILYIALLICGLSIHPFFYAFHLTDFLRISILQNVIKAIWNPRTQLILTLVFFMLVEYYFSIISYAVFSDHYFDTPYNETVTVDSSSSSSVPSFSVTTSTVRLLSGELQDSRLMQDAGNSSSANTTEVLVINHWRCDTLWQCFFSTYDFTFKQNGGVGSMILNPYLQSGDHVLSDLIAVNFYAFLERFFFDNIFNIIVVYVIFNMLAGIIIDTFGQLKNEFNSRERDEKNFCFICGIDREKLEKTSGNSGFFGHIKQEHYMWNYVFFKYYLESRPKQDLTGVENYVLDLIKKENVDWIPIKTSLSMNEEDDEDDDEKNVFLDQIKSEMDAITDLLGEKAKEFAKNSKN